MKTMKNKNLFGGAVLLTTAILLMPPASSSAQTIAGGEVHSLALCSNGTVMAWGYNSHGQLGNGNNIDSNVPVQVSNLTGVIAIAAGDFHSLALKNDGTVWAWGYNVFGQLGNGNNNNSNVPVQTIGLCTILTAVNEITEQEVFSVFPNPFSSTTIIQSEKFLHNATLTVYNSFGQIVKEIKNISGQTITLHRDNLPEGMYFIRLTEENRTIAVDKLVIME